MWTQLRWTNSRRTFTSPASCFGCRARRRALRSELGLEQLPLEDADEADEDIEDGRARLRDAIRSQIKEFENLLEWFESRP